MFAAVVGPLLILSSPNHTANDMIFIPIEIIFSNRDSIRKAREAFLIQKGRTIDPDGLNIRVISEAQRGRKNGQKDEKKKKAKMSQVEWKEVTKDLEMVNHSIVNRFFPKTWLNDVGESFLMMKMMTYW